MANKVIDNSVVSADYIYEKDNEILGYANDESGDEINTCIPVGAVGKNDDSLPSNSIILKNYELIFQASEIIEREVGSCRKNDAPVMVQKAYGELTLNKIGKNGEITNIITVPAISGSGGNGCIPNNKYSEMKQPVKYYAGKLVHSLDFHDGYIHSENGKWVADNKEHAWKIYIYDEFINRGLFRIHPTTMNNGDPSSNDGCISPYPSQNSVAFHNEIEKILIKSNYVIPLIVDVTGNFNITVQRKNYQKKYVP